MTDRELLDRKGHEVNDDLPIYPHHCAPHDVEALIKRLEALSDPEQEAFPSFDNTDWRTLASICARVIKYQRGDDWRHGE